METIQGGAGFIVLKNNYLKLVKQKCEDTGALLLLMKCKLVLEEQVRFLVLNILEIVNECANVMGGGLPIGAFCSSKKIMKLLLN